MSFTAYTGTAKAGGLIPTEYANEIIKLLPEQSAAVKMFKTVNMSSKTTVMPVLTALATAAFVSEGAAIGASSATWTGQSLVAEKIACIVPVAREIWEDTNFDLTAEIMPNIVSAFGKAIDAAVFHGTSKPSSWSGSNDIYLTATTNGSMLSLANFGITATTSLAEGVNQLMGLVEADGITCNGFIAAPAFKANLRGARATTGELLFQPMTAGFPATLWGEPIAFANSGGIDATKIKLIAGNFDYAVMGLRNDITVDVLTEASITVGGDTISLAQNDMIGLKFVMRVGYASCIPANTVNGTDMCPWAILTA